MATLTELTKPLTRAEVEATIYAAIAARGARTTSWKPGSVVRTIIVGVAVVLSALSRLQAELAKMGFLELAEGDWLTLVALYVYGVTRDEGSFASGQVTLDNAAGGAYAGVAGDLLFINGSSGKTYRNTSAFAVGPLETGVLVSVQAVELGTDSNAAAGEIDAFASGPLTGVTVTNALALTGSDREEDPSLRTRCYEQTGAISANGPRDAYAVVAKTTKRPDGASIGVTRTRTVADGEGGFMLYVAGPDGALEVGDVAILQTAVEALVTPLCVTPTVVEATAVPTAITYELWVRDVSGYTESEIRAQVLARLQAWAAVQPIGGHRKTGDPQGRIYLEAIESVIGAVRGDETIDLAVTLPAADVDLDVDEVAGLGTVTATVHLTSGGLVS